MSPPACHASPVITSPIVAHCDDICTRDASVAGYFDDENRYRGEDRKNMLYPEWESEKISIEV